MTKLITGLCAAAVLATAGAALGYDGKPTYQSHDLIKADEIQAYKAPKIDIAKEIQKDSERGEDGRKRGRFAVAHDVQLDLENSGVWEDAGDGLAVWRLRVTAENAASINFGFTDFQLPKKAELWVYNADGTAFEGPYTDEHNNEWNSLWTKVVAGEDVIVELTIPEEEFNNVALQIGRISGAYRGFGLTTEQAQAAGVPKSGSCNLDVICGAADGFPEVDAWRGQIPAVGAYTINGTAFCTGSLVNNTAQDGRPLFMTAAHCFSTQGSASGIQVYWNYENPTCRTPGSAASGTPISFNPFPSTSGSTLLMTTGGITGLPDTTLVELSSTPSPTLNLTYGGWDRTDVASYPSAVTIHHPGVDEKRISFEDQATSVTGYLDASGGGDSHWRIEDWDLGTTEGGSSGSPLYNPAGRVIGVLSGGFASCTSQTADWYGRLPVAWDFGGTPATRLDAHLDPLGTGVMFLDALGAGPIPFLTAGPLSDIQASGLIGGPFVGGTGTVTITNATEADADYEVNIISDPAGIAMLSGTTSGTLMDTEMVDVTISLNTAVAATLGAGQYTASVEIVDLTNAQIYFRDLVLEVGRVVYTSTDTQPISDNSSIESTLVIGDDICIADLDCEVNITHTFQGDLEIDLISPDGTIVRLRDNSGGGTDNVNETYDDEGLAPSGPGALSDFDNSSTLGTWILRVTDTAGGDTGTIDDWSIEVLSSGGDCPPSANDQSISASSNTATPITLTGFGTSALTYRVTGLPSDGDLIDPAGPNVITSTPYDLSGDMVTYISDPGYGGADSFQFVTDDGNLESFPATVDIDVDNSDTVLVINMDSDPGWTTDGGWGFGIPAGNGGDPNSGSTGSNVYGYNLAGAYGNNIDPTEYLTTTAFDFTGATDLVLCFDRWLGVERSMFDQATVDISIDGGSNWTNLYTNPDTTFQDAAWSTQTFDISAADNQSNVLIRWGLNTDVSVTRSGWNIDDVVIKGDDGGTDVTGGCCLSDGTCVVASAAACSDIGGSYQGDATDCSGGCGGVINTCDADFDNDGDVDLTDFGTFGAAFGSMTGDANYSAAADFDNDGDVDLTDFGTFGSEFGRTDCLD